MDWLLKYQPCLCHESKKDWQQQFKCVKYKFVKYIHKLVFQLSYRGFIYCFPLYLHFYIYFHTFNLYKFLLILLINLSQ